MDGLSLLYWVAVTTTLMSEDEPVKQLVRDTRVYEGANWGYGLIFFSFFSLFITMTLYFRSTEPGEFTWRTFVKALLAMSPILGMCIGYHYHVLYLNQ